MHGLVAHGAEVRYERVPDPAIEAEQDVIVRMLGASICGSDLHLIENRIAEPFAIGHEAIGEVVERGRGARSLAAGDRVLISGDVGCGTCRACAAGELKRCENDRLRVFGTNMGLGGCQSEFIRVPGAAFSALKIPEGMPDEHAVMLTDCLPTAYTACRRADITPGASVAVIGLGPIGLIAVELAFVLGAGCVYAIEPVEDRRRRAAALGAVPLSPEEAVEVIREQTHGAMTDSVVEAVGGKATAELAMAVVGPNRTVSILGVDFGYEVQVPFASMMSGVTVRVDMLTEIPRYWPELVQILRSGRFRLGSVFTHEFTLADGVAAYEKAARREPGTLKVLLRP
jgi:threonine dehydrogenase-like Zn-dependent dehydrogenase